MKITKPSDLQKGDKWLGMEFRRYSPEIERCQFDLVEAKSGEYISNDAIQTLIDAGNDEVLREPEIVEFEACVFHSTSHGYYITNDLPLKVYEGARVHVAVSKDRFSCIPGEVVASGEYDIPSSIRVDDENILSWFHNNAKPGDQITITRRKP